MFPLILETKYLFLLLNFMLGLLLTFLLMPPVINMIKKAEFVRSNFCGELIPVGAGIIFFIVSMIIMTLNFTILPLALKEKGMILSFAVAAITSLGLMDDNWGSREATGLKGHFKQLLKGNLTTGAVKALGGGLIAFLISLLQGQINLLIVNTLIIALAINAINLLDLRPGRAGKGFLLGALLLVAYGWKNDEIIFIFLFLGIILAFLPYDLKARVMMGDTGSNVLGIILGIVAVWILSWQVKIFLLLGLIAFHLLTEKYSLTKIIEKNKVLNYLDRMGRR